MKKLFLLIPLFLFSLLANAEVINITTTSPHSSNNLRQALDAAATGDVIEMAAGTYVETGDWLAVNDKDVTVRAAEGAEVIIKPQFSVRVKAGTTNQVGKITFINVKFDCSVLESDQLFVPSDDKANQSIVLKNCEFYDWSKNDALIKTTEERRLDVVDIDNCYFHGFEKSIIYLRNANLVSLSVTNSTFENVSASVTDAFWAAPIYVRATTGSVLVDHCTFYNVKSMSLSYGTVTVETIDDPVVSNCIFMLPTGIDMCATNLQAGGDVKNCLTFNYDNWQAYGHYKTATVTDCIKANPLFKNAAGGDFSLFASSPARGAADDDSDLGDPRWHTTVAPVAIPATLVPFDALLSEKSSIIQGTPDSIFLKTQSKEIIEWAKWKVSVAKDGLYDFTAYAKRTGSTSGQKLEIQVLNSDESETLKSKSDNSVPNEGTISSGAVNLVAGNTYVIKVLNNYDWAESKLLKVVAAYAGGKTIAVPDTLKPVDAIRSERAFVNEAGELRFTDDDHTGYIYDQWGKWNISVAEAGKYKFTANVNSANNQNYRITLKNSDETSTLGTWYGTGNSSGARKIATELVDLTIGNYVLTIEDTVKWSKGRVVNVVASYEGGKTVNAPGQILAKEAVIGHDGSHELKLSHLMENGDLRFDDNGYNLEEFATWTLNVTEAGEMEVSFNSPSGGHQFRFELYQGETLIGASEESEANWVHNVTLTDHLTISATGDYTLKLINKQAHSSARLHSVTFAPYVAPTVVTMDDEDDDISAWSEYVGGAACNVTLNRTIAGGMFNAICLPFALTGSQLRAAFGSDVQLYYLNNASMDGDVLNLQFAAASDIYQGTPYLIKTSSNVVNPSFTGVSIVLNAASSTYSSGWPVAFKGTFVAKSIPAGDGNLLLYSDNQVGFPSADKTLKGFRAYFEVQSSAGAPIRSARIIAGEQVATAFDLVQLENNGAIKLIENGQLIIIHDGIRYNVMGQIVK